MATWLVTGGAGFIGFHLCARLAADGVRVVALDNLDDYYDPGLKKARLAGLEARGSFAFELGDVRDGELLRSVFERFEPDVVVHLAAQPGVRHSHQAPVAVTDTNVVGTVQLLEAARAASVAHVLVASSSSVYGDGPAPFRVDDPADRPASLYAATKRAAELVAHSYASVYGLPVTALRFFTVYGPWGRPDMSYYRFAQALHERRPLTVYGDGEALRDFTYVEDVVEALLRVGAQPPQGYRVLNVGRGERVSVNEMIGVLERLLGRQATRRAEPVQPGDVRVTESDSAALTAATGFTPKVGLEEGMRRFVEWFTGYHGVR